LGIFLYFYFILFWHASAIAAKPQEKITQVHILSVISETKTIRKNYIGYVKPIHQVAVHAYIAGFIDKVVVQGGQEVKSGDLLFVIKQGEYLAQLDLAKAKVAQTQATLENATIHYNRMKTAGKQAISKTDLDNAKTAVLTAEAALQQAKADERLAQVNYDYTTLYAAISGRVGDVSITNGDYIFPQSSPLLSIIQFDPIRVQFSISDKDYLNEIKQDKPPFSDWKMYLKLANGIVYNKNGQIKYFNNEVNPRTSAIMVYADFDNPDSLLLPNSYVDVILEKQIENGIFIPQSAVNFTQDGGAVYTLSQDNKITLTSVQVGAVSDGLYHITNGLKPGMKVITDKISSYQVGQSAVVQGDNP
jgi:RND family efflux transporter MFP subunit